LIRQLLTESLLLSLIGGAMGLLLAYWSKGFLLALLPGEGAPLTLDIDTDVRVLAFTGGVSLLTGLLFGLAPALRATRVDLMPSLKDNAGTASRARSRLSKVLLVAQVAVSLLLLIGAGLFVRTLQNLERVELGFNKDNLLLFKVDPTLNGYKGVRLASLYQQISERIEALPGVRSVTSSTHILISNSASINKVSVAGYTPSPGEKGYVYVQKVRQNFLDTMGIPVLAGRNLNSQDAEKAPKVAVVNETFARKYFSDESPLGRRFKLERTAKDDFVEIVGVARNAKYSSLRDETPPTIYIPYLQNLPSLGQMSFEVRAAGDPRDIAASVRQAVQEIDSSVPIYNLKTQSEQVDEHLAQEHLFARLSSFFGLLALALASIGLYGLLSYSVARRTHEIGIRCALGAHAGDVIWLVMKESLVVVLAGIAIGLPAALASTQVITSMLFGLSATDPVTILISVLFLVIVSALAGYLPARRAARVSPMVALKYE
jgi:predicted permease